MTFLVDFVAETIKKRCFCIQNLQKNRYFCAEKLKVGDSF